MNKYSLKDLQIKIQYTISDLLLIFCEKYYLHGNILLIP